MGSPLKLGGLGVLLGIEVALRGCDFLGASREFVGVAYE